MRLATLSIIGAVSSVLCTAALAADKVQVNAYVEALCPYCAEFTAGELADVFKTGVAEIADIRLIPFGNARQKAEVPPFWSSLNCDACIANGELRFMS